MIRYRGLDRQTSIKITIDGTQYAYSANGTAQGVTLLFEKLNLENKLHSVEISAVNSGTYSIFDFDAVDIDKDGNVIDATISAPTNLKAIAGNSKVELSWTASSNGIGYKIRRSTTAGGPYETIATNVTNTVYTDTSVINETTYYYVVAAINESRESNYSNEATAKPQGVVVPDPEPSGDRAILTITLTAGLEKEFDLSNTEVKAFLEWYDAHDAGTGPAKFAINKHDNNKGPFSKRTEYVIFDKILTFSVDEYSAK
ncbi:fibronectin type III domain-containing protein [Paenibacillus sp. FSL R5-0470]|uniref:fibronectin type III domain-containing protein n=1 Tax=Paenibacillus sp. FSL R5-0470 TaxID=2921641 RepID=UPI0030D92ED7